MIDVGLALDLLAVAVAERGPDYVYPPVPDSAKDCVHDLSKGPLSLVRHALTLADARVERLDCLVGTRLRDLYAAGRLPIPLTLGAAVVLDAAERAQDRGRPWGEALTDAQDVAARLVDLLPARAFPVDPARQKADAGRPFRVRH